MAGNSLCTVNNRPIFVLQIFIWHRFREKPQATGEGQKSLWTCSARGVQSAGKRQDLQALKPLEQTLLVCLLRLHWDSNLRGSQNWTWFFGKWFLQGGAALNSSDWSSSALFSQVCFWPNPPFVPLIWGARTALWGTPPALTPDSHGCREFVGQCFLST